MLNYSRLHLFGIEMFFVEFRGYLSFMEDYIERSVKEFDEKESIKGIEKYEKEDPDYYSHLVDMYSERWFEINTYYPHNFRASFLVQTFSMIEFELKKICDHYHRVMKTDFGVKDLRGFSDMEKCHLYLKKACKVDFKNMQADWDYINMMRRLRNQIVHHQGKISQSDQNWGSISGFIAKNPQFMKFKENTDELNDDGTRYYADKLHHEFTILIKDKGLNDQFLNVTERFFKVLLEQELKYLIN